ncbi:hypothetical protein [Baekduia soli]|uniref:hypothetical protein n=1 Tax=Baekduia soli TaxID=496014 RepID=UPI0016524F5A|nr:hypothetical protein [Baekduia soli]
MGREHDVALAAGHPEPDRQRLEAAVGVQHGAVEHLVGPRRGEPEHRAVQLAQVEHLPRGLPQVERGPVPGGLGGGRHGA